MDEIKLGQLWDLNADVWTHDYQAGYDKHRDLVSAPAFLAMLPDVQGQTGLDIGCCEGHGTRLVAQCGAFMTGLDISKRFIDHANRQEASDRLGIQYTVAGAANLPFDSNSFHFVISSMSMMYMPDPMEVIREVRRILKPGGFFQFSIIHPCFFTPRWKRIKNESGETIAIETSEYFSIKQLWVDEWVFGNTSHKSMEQLAKHHVAYFPHTLSRWLNMLLESDFILERFDEPSASKELARVHPELADTRVIACNLMIRSRKPRVSYS